MTPRRDALKYISGKRVTLPKFIEDHSEEVWIDLKTHNLAAVNKHGFVVLTDWGEICSFKC